MGYVWILRDPSESILPLVLSMFKAAVGSAIGKTMSRKPRPFYPLETMTERWYVDEPPLRKIEKPVTLSGCCTPDEPRRRTLNLAGRFTTFIGHSPSPGTQHVSRKLPTRGFSLGNRRMGSIFFGGWLRGWVPFCLDLNADRCGTGLEAAGNEGRVVTVEHQRGQGPQTGARGHGQ